MSVIAQLLLGSAIVISVARAREPELLDGSVSSGRGAALASAAEFATVPEDEASQFTEPHVGGEQRWRLDEYGDEGGVECGSMVTGSTEPSDSYFSKFKWLGLRHSSTHGRYSGYGHPLLGTSWRNRPYYFGADLGSLFLTEPINEHLTDDIDVFGGIFAGWDWDHYWGTELGVHRATPELINDQAPDAIRNDRLIIWSASMLYYPWGDSAVRPYWRCGVGSTEIDFPTDDGTRRDEALWTIPIGIGVKYPIQRWLAARAEFADQLAFGEDDVATQHNLTLTFGLEWRFGVHPQSYWPWNPSRYIW